MANVSLRHVYKIYDGGVTAVTDFNLEIADKEFIILVGPSGCGKSTTLRMIAGLEHQDSGDVFIDGVCVNDVPVEKRGIGFVFQNYSLIKHLRVWENIELPLLYAKKSFTAKQRHEIITGLLKSVGLESKENDYPINLSGGEQQRVAIARALAVSPEAILCDEPTGALDKKTGTQIMELLHSVVKEKGIMLLLVTHDPDIADTCDTIFEMDGGRITCAKNDT